MIHYIICVVDNYESTASYNRVRLICQGLLKNRVKTTLHLLKIKTYKNKLLRAFEMYIISHIRGSFSLFSLLMKVNKEDVVIVYSELSQFWIFPLFQRKTNLVIERTEYPYDEINDNRSKIANYYTRKNMEFLPYASSIITCSSYLKNYYQKYVMDIVVIPLVVDICEFSPKVNNHKEIGEYIAYCGSFDNNKDGLPILIDSFKLFHDSHPQMHLVLMGTGTENNINILKQKISSFGLSDYVIFTGRLSHEEVCAWLIHATILALARPNNKQAEGGVPSKVGEYLASGVPCVITKTGDLPNYLEDGVDCFLCEPDSAQAFADRLEDCYMSDRISVGRKGIEKARLFSEESQAKFLITYLKDKYGVNCIEYGS